MSKQTPQIRFKGFTDDWEERKLGDISKVIDPHPSHRAPVAVEKGIPFIGIGDVNEVGNINYKTARIVDEKIFDEHHNRYDLSIPSIGIGRVASLGKVIRLRDDIGKYAVSPTMSVIQFTNNNDLDFLYSNMNTTIFQKQFKSFSNGSTRQSVGIQDLRILMVSLPIDIEEQQKIGSFFKQLDGTIALHQRKLDLLKEQKKGFLQKMFPKNGAKVPELRFAGFADDWEERKLGEYVNFLNGRAYKQKELLDTGKYRVLRVGNFNTNDRWYYSDLELDQNKYANNGDLLYLWATNFGPEIWNEEKIIYHYHIWKLELLNNNIDKQYLYTWLITDKERIKQSTNGTTMVHVTKGSIEQRNFQFPSIEEQQKIGSFFKGLNDTIALHQCKLDLLKEQKKGFLQKMFVS